MKKWRFKMQLCDEYPFLTDYFNTAITNSNRNIAHCLLFYGNDIQTQYDLALYIARLLNCKKEKSENCSCLNCNWIRENQHPAVLTISKIDNKPDDDKSKTVISINQAQMIKQSLTKTSDFHRVFIFCDKNKENEPQGLNEKNFQVPALNSLLKIIEEPPSNTTFIFLTCDKNDLISTIVSRSQCFFVPSKKIESYDYSMIQEIFENYLSFEKTDVFELAQKLITVSDDRIKTINAMQNYMLSLLKTNLDNKQLKLRLLKDLKTTQDIQKKLIAETQKKIDVKIAPIDLFENLCLNIIQ